MIQASSAFTTANAVLRKTPIFLIQIAGYSRAFTNQPTGISGQYDWLESIDDHSITVNDLDGGADLGEFAFNVQDRHGAITGDFPGFTFEGKAITCKTGFLGMSQSDFALLFTGKVDTVSSDNNNTEYHFSCVDNKDILTKVIYTTDADGNNTDSDHRVNLNDHPLNILSDILENELGLTVNDYNASKVQLYRDGLFAGMTFVFSIDTAPAAKDFIENEIMKPLGGYIWVNSRGQIDFNFFRRDKRILVNPGCLICAWVDGSGNVVGSPFSAAVPAGQSLTVIAPAGAARLSLGVDDHYYTDNSGSWVVDVSGTHVTVGGAARPWDYTAGVKNPLLPFDTTGSTSPVTTVISTGALYVISWVSGSVSIGPGWNFTDTAGNIGYGAPAPDSSGSQAVSIPLSITTPDLTLNHDNMEGPDAPLATQADLINTVSFRFDKDVDGSFHAESVLEYTQSTALYGQFGQQVIESSGMRSGLQGFSAAAATSRMLFLRYGLKNLEFQSVVAHWTTAVLEPGDLVALTSPFIPDREAGVVGITAKLFEVLDRSWDFHACLVTVRLLDASYLQKYLGQYLIEPPGLPAFTGATAYQKGRYMFMCSDLDKYSDGTAGYPLG